MSTDVIVRGRKAKALLTDEDVAAYFADVESRALDLMLNAKTETERIEIMADVKAHRGLRRALELAQHAGEQAEKKEARNA